MNRKLVCIVVLFAIAVNCLRAGVQSSYGRRRQAAKEATQRKRFGVTLVPVYTPISYRLVPNVVKLIGNGRHT